MPAIFRNRSDAGQQLALFLGDMARRQNALILALPRGGVPVAHELAAALQVPMDILLVRKLGVPGHEELAMGAIALGGIRVLNHDIIDVLNIPDPVIDAVAAMEEAELARRNRLYRGGYPAPEVRGRDIIIVDDGLATGATMQAAVRAMRAARAGSVIAAAPVGSPETCQKLALEADRIVCPHQPEPFYGVGVWYHDFSQTPDEEVLALLNRSERGTNAMT